MTLFSICSSSARLPRPTRARSVGHARSWLEFLRRSDSRKSEKRPSVRPAWGTHEIQDRRVSPGEPHSISPESRSGFLKTPDGREDRPAFRRTPERYAGHQQLQCRIAAGAEIHKLLT